MKGLKHSKINLLVVIFCMATLFISCDMDKIKSAAGGSESVSIDNVDIALCNSKDDQNHHGCTCSFRSAKDDPNSVIFTSNMNRSKNACISINGTTEVFTGKRIDHKDEHHRKSHMPNWVMVTEKGELALFDHLADASEYDKLKDELVQVLLATHKLPEEIPTKLGDYAGDELKGTITKLCADALDTAKKERAGGNHGAPIEIELSNDNYNVYIKGEVENHNDDGSDNYAGTIEVKDKEGKVVGTKDFWGNCLCS